MKIPSIKNETMPKLIQQEIHKRFAFHAAGYAASICLGNKQKGLPAVSFQIVKKPLQHQSSVVRYLGTQHNNLVAKIEGGRLIDNLPACWSEATEDLTEAEKTVMERSFEADVANILTGPLSEAKYVAQRDDELITARLVNLKALAFYNGANDVELVSKYFECLNMPANEKERKIVDIYFDSFSFISECSNWTAISKLAGYILESEALVIDADEVMAVIDNFSG